jgi:hypothetical protein
MFRIFEADTELYRLRDVEEWMEYMRFAGVSHFYLYDQCHNETECQRVLDDPARFPHVTYHRWPTAGMPKLSRMAGQPGFSPTSTWEQEDYMDCQHSAIVHAAYNYGSCSTWQIVIDFDEYPHSQTDSEPGFITRVIERYTKMGQLKTGWAAMGTVTQLIIQNVMFKGHSERPEEPSRIGRNTRRDKNPSFGAAFTPTMKAKQNRVKPIYMVQNLKKVEYANPHVFKMKAGQTKMIAADQLVCNHYWGYRGGDGAKIADSTMIDEGVDAVIKQVPLLHTPASPESLTIASGHGPMENTANGKR